MQENTDYRLKNTNSTESLRSNHKLIFFCPESMTFRLCNVCRNYRPRVLRLILLI